jgi:hypothetical protein
MLWFNAVSLPLVFDTLVKKFARLCCAFALVPTSSPLFQAPCFTEAADWWLYFFFEPDRTVTNESGSRLYCMTRSLVLSVWRILWYVCAQQGRHCHALAGAGRKLIALYPNRLTIIPKLVSTSSVSNACSMSN